LVLDELLPKDTHGGSGRRDQTVLRGFARGR